MNNDRSVPVAMHGYENVEREGQGKRVVDVVVRLEARYGPTPARRVVSITTGDGAVYRFQRFGPDEPLAFFNREKPDGSEFRRKAALPGHVEDVRDAIVDGEVRPEPVALANAEEVVGERDQDRRDVSTGADGSNALAADGGTQEPVLAGIEVAHRARSSSTYDEYGGRHGDGDKLSHAANTDPGDPGWLGNPYIMEEETIEERRRVIGAFLRYFVDRIEDDDEFREAVEDLRGQRVACWCRGVTQGRTPDKWCHLDVVDAWLSGDLSPVYDYLRSGQNKLNDY